MKDVLILSTSLRSLPNVSVVSWGYFFSTWYVDLQITVIKSDTGLSYNFNFYRRPITSSTTSSLSRAEVLAPDVSESFLVPYCL